MGEREIKTYLDVPYPAKERAKALGARYDTPQRKWYCPDGLDLMLFAEWIPKELAKWRELPKRKKKRRR